MHSAHDTSATTHRSNAKTSAIASVRTAIRASPWLTIAISMHVVLGACFAVVYMSHERVAEDTNVIEILAKRTRIEDFVPEQVEPPELFDRHLVPENDAVELVPDTVAAVTMPDLFEDPNPDLSLEVGDPNPTDALPGARGSTSIGVGEGGHRGFGPAVRSSRLLGNDGSLNIVPGRRPSRETRQTQEAVQHGLVWLARHQERSGHWSAATFMNLCPPGLPCQPETAIDPGIYSHQVDVGLTGLSLLCFLGAGLGHDCKAFLVDPVNKRRLVIGKDIVRPGLQWLVDRQQDDGSFTAGGGVFLYNEAIAALALSEAYELSQHNRYWKEPAQRAIDFLCRAQKPDPTAPVKKWGWRYAAAEAVEPGAAVTREQSDADMSVTGWMVMALKSAQLSGLDVPQASIDGALEFTRWCTASKGLVGYTSPDTAGDPVLGEHENFTYHVGTMSSIGMCVRAFLERDSSDPFLAQAADVLLKDLPVIGTDDAHPTLDYYYWYYGSLALNQFDGPDAPNRSNRYWGPWNKAMQDTLLELQDRTDGACSRGGWMRPDRWSYGVGPIYTTAINVLTLEVYYRYPNAFGTVRPK